LWRLSFPEVVEDNDRLADLHRVANYLAGAKLPPIDYWLPYQRFNYTTLSSTTVRHCSAGCSAWGRARASRSPSRSRARLGLRVAVDADYRWMEFSTTPEAHVGLWVRR
jgi:hypothetical protein